MHNKECTGLKRHSLGQTLLVPSARFASGAGQAFVVSHVSWLLEIEKEHCYSATWSRARLIPKGYDKPALFSIENAPPNKQYKHVPNT